MSHSSRRHGPRRRLLTPEDAALWSLVAQQVRPIAKADSLTPEVLLGIEESLAPAAPSAAAPAPTAAGPAPSPAVRSPVKPARVPARPLPPVVPPPLPGIDRRTLQRLRRGILPVEARLDLHGHSQESAHLALTAFLRSARLAGRRIVLVITGKGAPGGVVPGPEGGRGRGVLRAAVPRWLREPELAAMVVGVASAGPQHGGGGALYIQLRRVRGPAGPGSS